MKTFFFSPRWLLVVGVLFWASAPVGSGKYIIRNFALRPQSVHYLTNFGCAIGDCTWKLRVRVRNGGNRSGAAQQKKGNAPPTNGQVSSSDLAIRIVLDETWEGPVMKRKTTCDNARLARVTRSVTVPFDGEWSGWISGVLSQTVRPHHWYYVVDDCHSTFATKMAAYNGMPLEQMRRARLEFELEALQYNGSHFSYEWFGTSSVALVQTVAFLLALLFMARKQLALRKMGKGRVHIMVQLLNVCILLQLLGSIFHLVHLVQYSRTGRESLASDCLSDGLSLISQVVVAVVLILISTGFSLNVPDGVSGDVKKLMWPIAGALGLLHVALIALDRSRADERYRYVSMSGLTAALLAVIRVVLWVGFSMSTFNSISRSSTPKGVKSFLRKLFIVGSVYFLSFPVVYTSAFLFPAYLQHRVLSNGIFALQLSSMLWLSHLFVASKGDFFKASELSQSYLPGGYLSPTGVYRLD